MQQLISTLKIRFKLLIIFVKGISTNALYYPQYIIFALHFHCPNGMNLLLLLYLSGFWLRANETFE